MYLGIYGEAEYAIQTVDILSRLSRTQRNRPKIEEEKFNNQIIPVSHSILKARRTTQRLK
jgi:hypothetical protein